MKPGMRVSIGDHEGVIESVDDKGQIIQVKLDSGGDWWRPDMKWVRRIS